MKKYLLLIIFFQAINLSAQIDVKIYHEATENGYAIFVDNNELCPISIEFKFNLTNLKSVEGKNKIFVIPAQGKRIKVTNLEVIKKNASYKLSYDTTYNYGDHFLTTYNTDFLYSLPFSKGSKYKIGQGYNGSFSHQNQNALDFTMPVGTDIAAARAGLVISVTQKNNKTCATKTCAQFNNFVSIFHDDGTFAEYTHIKQNGALVKKGDKVEVGQIIAKSGNVGWSNGPHLHFVVYFQRIGKRETLKTKFKTLSGQVDELLEKSEYEN
jgi:murein DD-endopeptidase MepM/ murein hydrolase activator NlpD